MKKISQVLLLFFSLIYSTMSDARQSAPFSQPFFSTDSLPAEKIPLMVDLRLQELPYEETAFERFQVIFFISLPFVLVSQYALLSIGHILTMNSTNLQFDTNSYIYLGMASVMTSAVIAGYDAYRNNQKADAQPFRLSFDYRF